MPGIAGLVDVGNTVDTKTLLQQMLDEMKHEEFHLAESFFDPPVGIGRVHLNVEDSCRQPVFSRDQKKCIVMIGEVYSYRNLPDYLNLSAEERDSEPSIVLRLYSEFGLNFVNFLNGSFLLAIWDSDARKMLIANDRYGLFPLYYANFGGVFLFASEVKSILQMKTFPRVLDGRSVADFFSFGYILGNKTLLKDVKVMPPACIFVADGRKNQVDIEKYWDLGFKEDKRIDLQNAGKTFHTLLKISVSRQIPKNRRFGFALSGGIDSRLILAAIEKDLLDKVFAFTIGTKESSDLHVAKIVCNTLQIPNHFWPLTAKDLRDFARKTIYLTDGMWLFHHSLGAYAVNLKLKRHFDIVFTGNEGALFRGRYLSKNVFNVADDNELAEVLFRRINTLIPLCQQDRFYSPAYVHIAKYPFHDLREEISKVGDMSAADKTDCVFMHNRFRRFINLGLIHTRNFFECKTPFFDYDLVDYIQTVPTSLRLNDRVLKQVFSTYYPKLDDVPYARYLGPYNIPMARHPVPGRLEGVMGSYLSGAWLRSAQILQSMTSARLKFINPHPIADANYWFRTELKDFVEGVLFDSETMARPYFNHGYIAELVKTHMTGKKNLVDVLGALVTFELWHRMFLDQ